MSATLITIDCSEGASTKGVPLPERASHDAIRDLLGHALITTTERYDNQKLENLQAAVLKLRSGRSSIRPTPRTRATRTIVAMTRTTVSSFFQEKAKVSGIDDQKSVDETAANVESENESSDWLAVRDDFRNWLIHAA